MLKPLESREDNNKAKTISESQKKEFGDKHSFEAKNEEREIK